MRSGGEHARLVNSLVTASALTRMIAERLQAGEQPGETLLVLGIEMAESADSICTELDDPELTHCRLAAGACIDALQALR